MTRRERIRGCLLGGAVGDALGAPVEFDSRERILARYGAGGIREMDVAYGVRGAITDDTQMTLFTAEGILRAVIRGRLRGICNPASIVGLAYRRWLVTQGQRPRPNGDGQIELSAASEEPMGWLFNVRELHSCRAPGNTCLSALRSATGAGEAARNDSKGCGAVMRVAPVAFAAFQPYAFGCDTARLTHGHPLGWTSAGVFALLLAELSEGIRLDDAVSRFVAAPTAPMRERDSFLEVEWPEEEKAALEELGRLLQRASELARADTPAHVAIAQLGEGWVAEEALAIAVFCALRSPDDLEEAVVAAINHSGDSDSTGSMAGQLCGTSLGETAIPGRWLTELELREVVAQVADDLADLDEGKVFVSEGGYPDTAPGWWERYPGC